MRVRINQLLAAPAKRMRAPVAAAPPGPISPPEVKRRLEHATRRRIQIWDPAEFGHKYPGGIPPTCMPFEHRRTSKDGSIFCDAPEGFVFIKTERKPGSVGKPGDCRPGEAALLSQRDIEGRTWMLCRLPVPGEKTSRKPQRAIKVDPSAHPHLYRGALASHVQCTREGRCEATQGRLWMDACDESHPNPLAVAIDRAGLLWYLCGPDPDPPAPTDPTWRHCIEQPQPYPQAHLTPKCPPPSFAGDLGGYPACCAPKGMRWTRVPCSAKQPPLRTIGTITDTRGTHHYLCGPPASTRLNKGTPMQGRSQVPWPFFGAGGSDYSALGYYGNFRLPNPMPTWGWALGAAAAGGAIAAGTASYCWPKKRVFAETLEEDDGKILSERWVDDLGCFAKPRFEAHYLNLKTDTHMMHGFNTLEEAKQFPKVGGAAPAQNPALAAAVRPQPGQVPVDVRYGPIANNPLPGPWWAWAAGGIATAGVALYCWPKGNVWSGKVEAGGETVELRVDYLGCWKSHPYLATYHDTLTGASASRQFRTLAEAKKFKAEEENKEAKTAQFRERNPKCTHCVSIDPFTGKCSARWCKHCELKDPFGGPDRLCHWATTPTSPAPLPPGFRHRARRTQAAARRY